MSDDFEILPLGELVDKAKDHVPPPYTEGPWVIEKDHGLPYTMIGEPIAIVGGDETGESVRFTVGRNCDFGPHGPEQTEANARLIAAAPDLLAALEGILAITDRNHVVWQAARDAIAKAKGERK